ncbi:SDR family oxidoreductase [Brevibacterium luteolum]|uniref:SDR family oxidoreductase n=1 Tax=Brevibacterium luteolum TaxID=199591 RepID=UPI00223C4092|nr:SDR family oxidoreductase [Brevibacterium luteolum]MCT1872682.1 SDR family oxidoreductase [Brevibacterium luteolum]MCT1890111.1 SDR family oxidoreductase [Brevibacterium luteolum]MCT1892621.1 SDR family oxidoreductase [Brevibacterium luteolum]MCT1922994.1 SDR family oxidoreductase [Brevibacterium luteolum]
MKHPLSGRTVLITGAGSGIGRLLAEGAAARGARVVIWDLSPASGAEVCEAIRARGGEALSFAVDVTDREAVAAAADQTGPVDVLVNNAGIVTGKRLLDAADEEIERTFAVNTLALYWVTRAFLPGMIARRSGLVVTIASAAGLVGVAKQTDYSASKFAAVGFAESLRVELAKDDTGVDSFVVCPYYIDTGMFAGAKTKFPRLLPILSPDYAAGRTLDAIESGRIQLIMPRFVRTLPLVRMLPAGWFDQIMNVLGVNNTMDAFTGRSQPAEPRAATAGRQA